MIDGDASSLPTILQSWVKQPQANRQKRVTLALGNVAQAIRDAVTVGYDLLPEYERDELIEAASTADQLAAFLAAPSQEEGQ